MIGGALTGVSSSRSSPVRAALQILGPRLSHRFFSSAGMAQIGLHNLDVVITFSEFTGQVSALIRSPAGVWGTSAERLSLLDRLRRIDELMQLELSRGYLA